MTRRKGRKNIDHETDQVEERMNEAMRNILKLKQTKSSNKGLFTRTKHKLFELIENSSQEVERIKELRKNLTELHEKTMQTLSELTVEYGNIDNIDKQNCTMDETEEVNQEYDKVMDRVNDYVGQFRSEQISVCSTASRRSERSRVAQQQKEELLQKKKELEEKYLREKLEIEERLRKNGSIYEKETIDERNTNLSDYTSNWIEQSNRRMENWESLDENKSPEKDARIGKDLWKQLKRVSIPVFNGDKRQYENWKSAFMACVDKSPATPEYKLLQLRQYLSGEALKAIETLGHSGHAYEAAKDRLERKFGGERRKLMLFMDELENFKPVRMDHPKDLEKFADLLDIAVINLKEAKREEELGNGTFYRKLQRKLPEKLLTQYQRWIFENGKKNNVEELRLFVIQEADFQVAAEETIKGLHLSNRPKARGEQSYFGSNEKSKRQNQRKCVVCKVDHPLWKCDKFKQLGVLDRWKIAKDNKLCYRCLATDHIGNSCTRMSICGINGCKESHNRLLHKTLENQSANKQESPDQQISIPSKNMIEGEHHRQNTMHVSKSKEKVESMVLRTVPVILKNGQRKVVVNALLDDGSTKTYVNEDVVKELKLEGLREKASVGVLNGKLEEFETMHVEMELESLDGNVNMKINALTANKVTGDMRAISWRRYANQWKHLRSIPFPDVGPKPIVDILIGIDYAYLHRSLEEITGGPDEPIARKTPLGWTCIGGIRRDVSQPYKSNFIRTYKCYDMEMIKINNAIEKFWEIERVSEAKEPILNKDDQSALKKLSESIKFTNEKYEVKIPWKEDRYLPNNYNMALKRLYNTENRLKKQPELGETYCNIIKDYQKKGYLKEVIVDPVRDTGWFLPHFPVLRPDKATTKVRIVFDGSAKCEGQSLNDMIYQGPKLQNDLVNVLLRFRRFPVALVCDIAEMYLRIGIHEDDQPFQRILWRSLDEQESVKVLQFTRVVFGINASPFQAQYVSQQHAKSNMDKLPLAAETVLHSTYMDDSMDSVEDDKKAIKLYEELSEMWKTANMHARKWLSNSSEVLTRIPEEDRAAEIDLNNDELPSVKTLGVLWKAAEDSFSFKDKAIETDNNEVMTKRKLLKKIATLFDPLGFIAPFIMKGKMLLQEVWLTGLDWDEPLPSDLSTRIVTWYSNLTKLTTTQIPRCLQKKEQVQKISIHVFNDASEKAYGSVIYQRTEYVNGDITSRIVISKGKVSPLQSVSIPRLELMSAVLGLRLAKRVITVLGLNMSDVVYWCDSLNVLHWIRGMSRSYKPFVANRVGEIQSNSNPSQWRYVPTKSNPADLVSRGTKIENLESFWLTGPDFLVESEENWPARKIISLPSQLPEMKKSTLYTFHVNVRSEQLAVQSSKYSKWIKLIRVNAWVTRFISNCRSLPEKRETCNLSVDELRDSEIMIIRTMQKEAFSEEYKALANKKEISNNSKILSLYPYLDEDGLIRSNGRLDNARYLGYDTRYPIILPRRNWITQLIVRYYHEKGNHITGTNHTLSIISERFWVIKGREEIKDCESKCPECKRRKFKASSQIMAPLPAIRVKEPLQVFGRVAVDFGGPFLTKQGRSRKRTKRYLCLFTCLLSRAVHLEVSYGLDTDSFLNAFYRMVCRRGRPDEVLSDNGTNFVGANNELKELVEQLNQEKIESSLANKGIKWHFTPPTGPHFGGVHETMIKAAKKAIYGILSSADVTDEELTTAFTGAEDLINSRPLTYQSSDIRDEPPLTPNHFLIGRAGGQFAPKNVDEEEFHPKKRWRRIQELVKHVWKRWMKEWLPQLNRRQKWFKNKKDFRVGDTALVLSTDSSRGKWQMGRIIETFPGSDGHVRVAKVRIGKTEYVRPISKLCPLECDTE